MRSEKNMMNLIVGVAEKDNRVRGVYMNGSRTNPKAERDVFQDYDIVYVVEETASFIEDESWIDVFGERLYMQQPDKMDQILGYETDVESCYGYLIQLADGNRLDIHVQTLDYSIADMQKDKLCVVLLDKDKAFPWIPPSSDMNHWVKRPSQDEFVCCCNEFWWLLNNIGKGLWRSEVTYAMDMINLYSRPQLFKMLTWYTGIQTNFSCSVGKSGKYLHKYLSQSKYESLLKTYSSGNLDAIWFSVFKMCDFFDEIARKVANGMGFAYNEEEAYNSRLFLDCTYELPGDAAEMLMVRRMKETDVETAAEIWLESNLEVHNFIQEKYWRNNYEYILKQLGETEAYVYEDNHGIQGFVGIEKGYVKGIFVKKEMRSNGVGKALMNICKSKYFKMYLQVYCWNTEAVNFYMREGFKINRKQFNEDTKHSEYEMIWKKE